MIKKISVVLLLLLTSCSIEDKSFVNFEDKITRAWSIQETYLNGVKQSLSDCEKEDLIDIADNKMLIYYRSYIDNENCKSNQEFGRWSYSKKGIEVVWENGKFSNQTYQYEIIELTPSVMRWSWVANNGDVIEQVFN